MGKTILAAVVMMAMGASVGFAAPGAGAPAMGGPGARAGRGGARAAPATLGAAMRDMGATYKRIKAEYADAAKLETTLTDLSTMERDIAVSKMNLPDNVKAMTGDAQVKATKEYRSMMHNLLKNFVDLEQAVTDGKKDDAKKNIEEIDKIMDAGNKEFRPNE